MQEIIEFFRDTDILEITLNTLLMVFLSSVFAYIIGVPLGVIVVNTESDGLFPNKIVNKILGVIINIGRSIPFVILLVALLPVTKFIVGTFIGVKGMIVPLTIAAIPFVARLTEQSLKECNRGVIEAAKCMGMTNFQIIMKVMLVESFPSLIRGFSITTITLVGYSALSTLIGTDSLGSFAVTWGYFRNDNTKMIILLVFLIIIVQIIHYGFELLANVVNKNKKGK